MNYVNSIVQIESVDYTKGKKKIVNGLFDIDDLLCFLNIKKVIDCVLKRCQHPQHQTEIGKKYVSAIRSVPISRCICIVEKSKMLFPIGSVLCFNNTKNENKIDKD